MKNCIFCKIVKGEVPCDKIYEDEDAIVILDAFPTMKGQTLVVPKKHLAPSLFDLDNEIYAKLMLVAKKTANAIDKSLKPIKTGLIVEGLELDHVHIKLYPLEKEFGFKILEPKLSDEEMKEIAEKIKKSINS